MEHVKKGCHLLPSWRRTIRLLIICSVGRHRTRAGRGFDASGVSSAAPLIRRHAWCGARRLKAERQRSAQPTSRGCARSTRPCTWRRKHPAVHAHGPTCVGGGERHGELFLKVCFVAFSFLDNESWEIKQPVSPPGPQPRTNASPCFLPGARGQRSPQLFSQTSRRLSDP